MQVTGQELTKRNITLENAIAAHCLDGLEPDTQTIEYLKCVGEFGIEESLRRVKERIALDQFRKE